MCILSWTRHHFELGKHGKFLMVSKILLLFCFCIKIQDTEANIFKPIERASQYT